MHFAKSISVLKYHIHFNHSLIITMSLLHLQVLLLAILVVGDAASYNEETFKLPIIFPSDRPFKADLYLCTYISFNKSRHSDSLYITGFTPVAEMSVVHHMLVNIRQL